MSEAEGATLRLETFLEHLKTLPWCKQGETVLVAVHKATPEIIDVLGEHELKIFPGGMTVKMNKSVISNFKDKYDDGQPLPVVLVWKAEGVEVWYRRHKSNDYPYDTWQDPAAAAYERERVFIPSEDLGAKLPEYHADIVSKCRACPSMIPPM